MTLSVERSKKYLTDLRNLVREMREMADMHSRMLSGNVFDLDKAKDCIDAAELIGAIKARRNDADELECWLNASKP